MSPITSATIVGHTTASEPRPHILYLITVSREGAAAPHQVSRRYSEFVALHKSLGASAELPPKRILATTFVPTQWVDDALIAERKAGLNAFLAKVVEEPDLVEHPETKSFLAKTDRTTSKPAAKFDLEDALPSTLSRKQAEAAQAQLKTAAANTTYVSATYYPDWATGTNPISSLDFSKWGIINFAFAYPNSGNTVSFDSGATSTLKSLVSAAHSSGQGTKICLSIGGWGNCEYYSQACQSANRQTFAGSIASIVSQYNLDGVDFDWEFPDESGAGQPYSSSDSANFLILLQDLRAKIGTSKILSAAVSFLPWLGSNGNPLSDVSAYAKELTYVNLMNYDVFGAGSDPGPNAPLSDACGNSSQPQSNAQAGISAWTAANFPASQILLGLPLYGYCSQSSKTTIQHFKVPTTINEEGIEVAGVGPKPNYLKGAHARTKLPVNATKPVQANGNAAQGDLSSFWGQQIPFNQIVAYGALKLSGSAFVQNNGYSEGWDNCSDTPFLYDTSRTTVVTYDDTYSLGDKAELAKSMGCGGCFTWSLDQDYGTVLQDTVLGKLNLN